MGVINSFKITLAHPKTVSAIEHAIAKYTFSDNTRIKLLHKTAVLESKQLTNVLNLYLDGIDEPINGSLDYGIENIDQKTDKIYYSGYYSEFIRDINKFGMEKFETLLSTIFNAKEVDWEIE